MGPPERVGLAAMKPQSAACLRLLRSYPEGLTSRDAWLAIGCSRLAARVSDLRAEGFDVQAELVTVRSGERSVRVARYRLAEAPRQLGLSL